jgi:hypothetical protein
MIHSHGWVTPIAPAVYLALSKFCSPLSPSIFGKPSVSDSSHMKYLYALMDDQTRFWIAQEVADTKFTGDIRPLFKMGKKVAGKQPKTLITDGAPNFHEA